MGFHLLSYNIQRGINLAGLFRIFDELPAFREADVVAIQEASFLEDGRNVLEALAEVLSPNHTWTYKTVMSYPDKEYGNGFLFRDSFEVVDSYSVPLPQVAKLKWYEKQKTRAGSPIRNPRSCSGLAKMDRSWKLQMCILISAEVRNTVTDNWNTFSRKSGSGPTFQPAILSGTHRP
jgi:hypothetical protein